MAEQPQVRAPGPAKGVLDIGQRIITIVVGMVETRLRLAVVKLREEKANLIQLLVMAGLMLLFTAYCLWPNELIDPDFFGLSIRSTG